MSGLGWKMVGGVLAVGTVGWGAFNIVSVLAHGERTEVRTYPAAEVDVIDVQNADGSVTVEGTPGRDEITVTAEISDGLLETDVSQQLADGQLDLRGSCPAVGSDWCDVSYTVEVPADIQVRADADNGRLRVSGIDGQVDLSGDNSSIEITDVSGSLTVGSDNGSITATGLTSDTVMAETDNGSTLLEFLEPPTTVEARSDNGSVEVIVPNTPDAYAVDMSTDNGEETREIRTDPTSSRRITIETDNGDATVRYAT
jgi:Putative adhesin